MDINGKNILVVLRSIQGFKGVHSSIKKNDLFEAILQYSEHLANVRLEDYVTSPEKNLEREIEKLAQEVVELRRQCKKLEFDRTFASENLKIAHQAIGMKKDLKNLQEENDKLRSAIRNCAFPSIGTKSSY
jgi:predicted RNase H-like nuclease (RuvC/YqgF family)